MKRLQVTVSDAEILRIKLEHGAVLLMTNAGCDLRFDAVTAYDFGKIQSVLNFYRNGFDFSVGANALSAATPSELYRHLKDVYGYLKGLDREVFTPSFLKQCTLCQGTVYAAITKLASLKLKYMGR